MTTRIGVALVSVMLVSCTSLSPSCPQSDAYAAYLVKVHDLEWGMFTPDKLAQLSGTKLIAERAEIPSDSVYGGPCTGATYYTDRPGDDTCRLWIAFHDQMDSRQECVSRLSSINLRVPVPRGESATYLASLIASLEAQGESSGYRGPDFRWDSADGTVSYNLWTAIEPGDDRTDIVFAKLSHTDR